MEMKTLLTQKLYLRTNDGAENRSLSGCGIKGVTNNLESQEEEVIGAVTSLLLIDGIAE